MQEHNAELSQQSLPGSEEKRKKMRKNACGWLRNHRLKELLHDKRRLVEVPYTATLAQTVNALVANDISAVPVAAPPGRWIGAGGSMILESDKVTGLVRKQYIGMVTMLDVLVHIGEEDLEGLNADLEKKMSVPVSSVIGCSIEGLSLWTLNPNTSILDCMETLSKGVHRALVPLESQRENIIAAELVEASPGYRMVTQMDVLIFLKVHGDELKDIISCSVGELGAVTQDVYAITKYTKVFEAIKFMRSISLNAAPIVEAFAAPGDGQILQDGKGRRLVDTFSATDLRGCSITELQSWLSINVAEFKERVSAKAIDDSTTHGDSNPKPRKLVTCYRETSLSDVIALAVEEHVHRVWVVDKNGLLMGLISLTDMLRVIREAVLLADHELKAVVSSNKATA